MRGREVRMREARTRGDETTRDVARPSGARAAIGDVAGGEARMRGREDARTRGGRHVVTTLVVSAAFRGAGGRAAGRIVPPHTWHGAGMAAFVPEVCSFVVACVALFVDGSDRAAARGREDARMRGREDARMRGCEDARTRGCEDARMRGGTKNHSRTDGIRVDCCYDERRWHDGSVPGIKHVLTITFI